MTDKIIMPPSLTAENGAKAALMGEFSVSLPVFHAECDGCGCTDCGGSGEVTRRINVPWTVIKEIYAKSVELLGEPLNAKAGKGCQQKGENENENETA